jgi:hypothetical protein
MDFTSPERKKLQPKSRLDKTPKNSALALEVGSYPLSITMGASVNDESTDIEHQSPSRSPWKTDTTDRGPRRERPSTQDEGDSEFHFLRDDFAKPDYNSVFHWNRPLPPEFTFLKSQAPPQKVVRDCYPILVLLSTAIPII